MTAQPFAYDKGSITGDYIRSFIGVSLTAAPLLFLGLTGWLQIIFAVCCALFIIFTIRTITRQLTHYTIEGEIFSQIGPLSKNIDLSKLSKFDIRYFSTRRNKDAGWFQAKIVAENRKIVVDSSLNGFDIIIEKAAKAAMNNKLALNDITTTNLNAILEPAKSKN